MTERIKELAMKVERQNRASEVRNNNIGEWMQV